MIHKVLEDVYDSQTHILFPPFSALIFVVPQHSHSSLFLAYVVILVTKQDNQAALHCLVKMQDTLEPQVEQTEQDRCLLCYVVVIFFAHFLSCHIIWHQSSLSNPDTHMPRRSVWWDRLSGSEGKRLSSDWARKEDTQCGSKNIQLILNDKLFCYSWLMSKLSKAAFVPCNISSFVLKFRSIIQ